MNYFNFIIWFIATIFLIRCGLYYTFKLKFIQFNFIKMFKSLKNDGDKKSITPFKTLSLALAARIGVGSLAGIALSIYKGGVGTIFWMLLSSLIIIPNSFVESSLAVIYHEKKGINYEGGPAFYIEKGLNNKWLAKTYAFIVILCYLGGFIAIQSNTISRSINTYLNISNVVTGLVISIISFFIISKGLKRITKFTSILVPFMGIIYILVSFYIVIRNINLIPSIMTNIINDALNFKSLSWGIVGSILIGIQRGIFSSEAGVGTGAIASGTSNSKNPFKQGYVQMLGVYFTTFIICLSTALIILTSKTDINSYINPNGIEITLNALNYHLGNFGTVILLVTLISFAFSTIISGYFYAESNIKYINNKVNIKFLNIILSIVLIIGSILSPSNLWNIVDMGVGILAIINSYVLILLSKNFISKYREVK